MTLRQNWGLHMRTCIGWQTTVNFHDKFQVSLRMVHPQSQNRRDLWSPSQASNVGHRWSRSFQKCSFELLQVRRRHYHSVWCAQCCEFCWGRELDVRGQALWSSRQPRVARGQQGGHQWKWLWRISNNPETSGRGSGEISGWQVSKFYCFSFVSRLYKYMRVRVRLGQAVWHDGLLKRTALFLMAAISSIEWGSFFAWQILMVGIPPEERYRYALPSQPIIVHI